MLAGDDTSTEQAQEPKAPSRQGPAAKQSPRLALEPRIVLNGAILATVDSGVATSGPDLAKSALGESK